MVKENKELLFDEAAPYMVSGEPVLVATGKTELLTDKPIKFTQQGKTALYRQPDKVYADLKEFLSTENFKKGGLDLPDLDTIELTLDLQKTLDPEWLAEKCSKLPDEFQQPTMVSYVRALDALRLNQPVLSTSIVSQRTRPTDFHVAKFERAYRTISDPYTIITDLQKGYLCRGQIDTLMQAYPHFYELIKSTLMVVGMELTAQDKEFEVPYNKLKQVSVLMLSTTVPPDLQTFLQQGFFGPDQTETLEQTSGKAPDIAEGSATKMQKLEQH